MNTTEEEELLNKNCDIRITEKEFARLVVNMREAHKAFGHLIMLVDQLAEKYLKEERH